VSSPNVSSPNDDFGVLLALAYVTFIDELDGAMAAAGHPRFTRWFGFVLRAIEHDAASLRQLADRLEMSSPGALKVVDQMVDAGYLERRPSPHDGRVRTIAATIRGHEALAAARQFHAAFEARLATTLGAEAAGATRTALTAIAAQGSRSVPRLFRTP
jgi:DNA-binding MarR family transcriptional regulator